MANPGHIVARRPPEVIVAPVVALLVIVGLCEVLVQVFHVGAGLLPAPSRVVPVLVSEVFPQYLQNLPVTLSVAALGYAIGNGLAILLALVVIGWAPVRVLVYQMGLILYALPFVAIAPILVILFGNGMEPRVIIVVLACFFPMLTNTIRGLLATPRNTHDLFRLYGATGLQKLRRLILPYALPYTFIGLKFTVGAAFLGALVSEWVGANNGVGTLLLYEMFAGRTPQVWATVLLTAATTGLLFALVTALERLIIPWSGRAS